MGDESLNGSYSYAYLPEMSVDDTAEYASSPDVKIVKLTETVHALQNSKLGIFAVNFYGEDEVNFGDITVKAQSPCCVMISGGTLALSDPTKYQSEIALTITKAGKTAEIKADTLNSMGKTFTFEF